MEREDGKTANMQKGSCSPRLGHVHRGEKNTRRIGGGKEGRGREEVLKRENEAWC